MVSYVAFSCTGTGSYMYYSSLAKMINVVLIQCDVIQDLIDVKCHHVGGKALNSHTVLKYVNKFGLFTWRPVTVARTRCMGGHLGTKDSHGQIVRLVMSFSLCANFPPFHRYFDWKMYSSIQLSRRNDL